MHRPRVVPSAEDYLASGQHRGVKVEILVETQLSHVTAVGIHQVDTARPFFAVPAGDARV